MLTPHPNCVIAFLFEVSPHKIKAAPPEANFGTPINPPQQLANLYADFSSNSLLKADFESAEACQHANLGAATFEKGSEGIPYLTAIFFDMSVKPLQTLFANVSVKPLQTCVRFYVSKAFTAIIFDMSVKPLQTCYLRCQ